MATVTTTESELRRQIWETVNRKGGLDEQNVEILHLRHPHGLTGFEAIESAEDLRTLTWGPSWPKPYYVFGPLASAWEVDQRAKGVPSCALPGAAERMAQMMPNCSLIHRLISHECTLAEGAA